MSSTPTDGPLTDLDRMRALAGRYEPDRSLDRLFYTSPDVYEHDIQHVWCKNWIWAGHISQLPDAGDFFLFEFASESIIVARDSNGEIRANLNVCRHRGSRVCLQQSGNARVFSCPYHGWTYELDGRLRHARIMDDAFDRAGHALEKVHVLVFHGFIFICLASQPPALHTALQRLEPHVEPFGLANLKIAHAADYPVPANWKLTLENYLECYHCARAHAEYSKSHSLKDPASMTEELVTSMRERSLQAGLTGEELSATGLAAQPIGADIYHRRYPLYPGYDTGSEDGRPLAPLLGSVTGYDGGATDIAIGPFNHFLAYSDHVVGYRFIPKGPQQTVLQTVWMISAEAEAGRDYDLDRLTWLWDVTTKADEQIIRNNQAGVNSLRYRPGPLSSMEWGISDFLSWYTSVVLDTADHLSLVGSADFRSEGPV